MSRGHGRVQRALLEIFQTTEGPQHDTADLCRIVYSAKEVTKAQRVAVLRALRGLAIGPLRHVARRVLAKERASDEWFDAGNGMPSNAALAREPRPPKRR